MSLVIEYRALNNVTIKNRYLLPLIYNIFKAYGGSQFFIKIDLTAGYHQICVNPEDIPKTAFRTKYRLFGCVVLNFGMINTPSTLITFINKVFKDQIWKYSIVYLDDIII